MSGAVGRVGGSPVQSNWMDGGTMTVQSGQTLDDIAKEWKVPKQALLELNPQAKDGIRPGMELIIPIRTNSQAGRIMKATRKPAKSVDLRPAPQNAVSQLLKNDPASAAKARSASGNGVGNASADRAPATADPKSVDQNYVLELSKKTPDQLKGWYESAPKGLRDAVQRNLAATNETDLNKVDRAPMNALVESLNDLRSSRTEGWAIREYGKLSDKDLMHKFSEMPPRRIIEDLQDLSSAKTREGNQVRERMITALGQAIQTQHPHRNPKIPMPMVSPGDIMESAIDLKGPGFSTVKAEVAGMFYRRAHDRSERAVPSGGCRTWRMARSTTGATASLEASRRSSAKPTTRWGRMRGSPQTANVDDSTRTARTSTRRRGRKRTVTSRRSWASPEQVSAHEPGAWSGGLDRQARSMSW